MAIQERTGSSAEANRTAVGSLGDIEAGNRVTSINGTRIIASNGQPSATGNWHDGDMATDYSVNPPRIWVYLSSASNWVKVTGA